MLRVKFYFRTEQTVEIWPDSTTRAELQERALALGAVCYTPTIEEQGDTNV